MAKKQNLRINTKEIKEVYQMYGEFCVQEMRDFLDKLWISQGRMGSAKETNLYKNLSFKITKAKISFELDEYVMYFNDGRKNYEGNIPKKALYNVEYKELNDAQKAYVRKRIPPKSAIETWLAGKGLDLNVYAVAYSISYKGLPAAVDEDGVSFLSIPLSNLDELENLFKDYLELKVDMTLENMIKKNIPGVKIFK
jgi:hypothetical protein